jgi:hypothetical protein
MLSRSLHTVWYVWALVLVSTAPLSAQDSLHQRIDQAITGGKADFDASAAPLASDAEFLRRVYLDLTGTIPAATEVRAFLADTATNKRELLIDRLLGSSEHARHMQNVFDVMLMERRGGKHIPQAQWQEYLRVSFAANKPWDQLVREILTADGVDPAERPAAKFYLDRLGEPHLLTRDISRLFLGTNLQCAQCHDHPRVSHYKQDHYYGIYAFLNRSFLFTDSRTKQAVFAEKGEGDVTYVSVFDPAKVTKSTGPRMPARPLVKEPALEKGKEYEVAPAKDVRPVPKFSRRAQLAAELTSPENVQFRRNIANRLWALLMGRGLVHPVDMQHPGNPPVHPELLELLADDLLARNYDMKGFLRELALSKTYQRSSEPPEGKEFSEDSFAVMHLKPLTPEQFAAALLQGSGLTDAERLVLGKGLTEAALHAKLAPSMVQVVNLFAAPAGQAEGQNFQATMDQALFVSNGSILRNWLAPRAGSLLDRLAKLKDEEVADELYLSVLTRPATAEERREVSDYLKPRSSDRAAALKDLAWALLASAEFRFNH